MDDVFTHLDRTANNGNNSNQHTIDLECSSASNANVSQTSSKVRHVRLIYCSDGVVEQCDEDDEEKARLEEEERQKVIEERKRMDLEAKNMKWVPWTAYMIKKGAIRSFEACDYMGEKLAWWLGITKPKFLYEIEEYNRMKREQEEREKDDQTEAIVIGPDGTSIVNVQSVSTVEEDVEMHRFSSNDKK